ncbi:MAG: NAD-dependent epimerase/dehydratase family protein [Deltaproteobacteria bacterium]|nr:NAD-dependent epimerase/dehydratase family protein [Deltaproteobacteria bacterium]
MRVFVTGGSGFVGGHVIEALRAAGSEVLALARSERSAAIVRGFGAEPVAGELGAIAAESLAGCDAVVHAAAHVEAWGPWDVFEQINVEGTRQLLEAAQHAGVRRFVHIGTEAALFAGDSLIDIDESAPYPQRQRYPYSASKAAAERLVLQADGVEAMRTIVLRPRLVWGPRDTSVGAAIERMAADGSWVWLDGGRARTSTCHVDNLCGAIVAALQADVGGKAYFVADEGERTMHEFLGAMAEARGLQLPERSLPGWLARALAGALDLLWRALGRRTPPPLSPFEAAMMSASITVRTERARDELGWSPQRTVAEGLAGLATAG